MPLDNMDDRLKQALVNRKKANLYRRRLVREPCPSPYIEIDKQKFLNFCSNDYLGLMNHPEVVADARSALEEYGVGSGASALVSGHTKIHQKLEDSLAEFTQRSRALLFPSGFAANVGTLSALVNRKDHLLMDRISHASLIDGAKLSTAKLQRYAHLDMYHLQALVSEPTDDKHNPWVITESLFSMDGDKAPLKKLAELCTKNQATLYVDDAHGIGLYGEGGAGSVIEAGLSEQQVPVLVGTFGKAFGVAGAFVAGSDALIENLIQSARSYVYTTASPPALAAATLKSLELIKKEHWRREKLFQIIDDFRSNAIAKGIPVSDHAKGPIQPILLGDSEKALQASEAMKKAQVLITAIRPPTVPEGTARLRITLSAAHEPEHLEKLVKTLSNVLNEIL